MAVIFLEVGPELKKKAEAQAKLEGKTLTEWVRSLISEWFQVRAAAADRKAVRKEGN